MKQEFFLDPPTYMLMLHLILDPIYTVIYTRNFEFCLHHTHFVEKEMRYKSTDPIYTVGRISRYSKVEIPRATCDHVQKLNRVFGNAL